MCVCEVDGSKQAGPMSEKIFRQLYCVHTPGDKRTGSGRSAIAYSSREVGHHPAGREHREGLTNNGTA